MNARSLSQRLAGSVESTVMTTQRIPLDWRPEVSAAGPIGPVLRAVRDAASLAVTQPIRFCADEAARIWIQAVRS